MNETIEHVHLRNGESLAYETVEHTGQWARCFGPIDDQTHSPDLVCRLIPAHEIKYVDTIEVAEEAVDQLEEGDDA